MTVFVDQASDHRRPACLCPARSNEPHRWAPIEPDAAIRCVRGASWLERGVREYCDRCGAVWPVAGYHARRLLDRAATPEEVAAEGDEPRPGVLAVWFNAAQWDLWTLTQDETDRWIRSEIAELSRDSAEHERITQSVGGVAADLLGDRFARVAGYSWQRGGIDSAPWFRVLARRAWGDRDRTWFEARGVKREDRVCEASNAAVVVSAWPGEHSYGRALRDARPGELVWTARDDEPVREASPHKVGDRRREPPVARPEPALTTEPATTCQRLAVAWQFDELTMWRDDAGTGSVWQARRGGAQVRSWLPDAALVTACAVEQIIGATMAMLERDLSEAGAPPRDAEPAMRGDVVASRAIALHLIRSASTLGEQLERRPRAGDDPATLSMIERWAPGTFPWGPR
jgi:hypothetical protein